MGDHPTPAALAPVGARIGPFAVRAVPVLAVPITPSLRSLHVKFRRRRDSMASRSSQPSERELLTMESESS
jgi:hypothetical protein